MVGDGQLGGGPLRFPQPPIFAFSAIFFERGEQRPQRRPCRGGAFLGRPRVHCIGTARSGVARSEEHTSELQSLMRISYAVFCVKKKKNMKQILGQHSQSKTYIRTTALRQKQQNKE